MTLLTVLRQHFTKSYRSLDTFDPFSPFSDPIAQNLTVLPTHSPLSYRSPSAFGIFFPFFYRFVSMLLLQVHDPPECPRIPRRNAPAAWYSLSLVSDMDLHQSGADTCAHRLMRSQISRARHNINRVHADTRALERYPTRAQRHLWG